MTFDAMLAPVLALLQREKRVSYRALKRRFDVEDTYLEDVKDERIYAKKLAVLCPLDMDSLCRRVQRQLQRNALTRFYHHRTRKCMPTRKLRREIP
jgi:hypothetical protein